MGCYHYFRTSSSVESQFENFKTLINIQAQDLIPLVDLEENDRFSSVEYNERVKRFLVLLEDYIGKKPILYSTQRFYNMYLKNRYKEYYWIIARYSKKTPVLLDNNEITIWQFTDKAKLKGISKNVDLNLLHKGHKFEWLLL